MEDNRLNINIYCENCFRTFNTDIKKINECPVCGTMVEIAITEFGYIDTRHSKKMFPLTLKN